MRALMTTALVGLIGCAPGTGAPAQPDRDHHSHGHHPNHRFTDAEQWAAQFDNPTRDAWQKPDAVIAALALRPDMAVADLGAGTGYFAVRLARAVPGGTVYAEDVEPDMVRYLGERATREGLRNLVALRGAPADPRLPGPVDAAIMVDTYHHLADPVGFFTRLREQMRPGATLAIVDFRPDAPADSPGPPAAMRIGDAAVVAALIPLGFAHVRTELELMPYQYLVLLRSEP